MASEGQGGEQGRLQTSEEEEDALARSRKKVRTGEEKFSGAQRLTRVRG